jgi:hypothetical protein
LATADADEGDNGEIVDNNGGGGDDDDDDASANTDTAGENARLRNDNEPIVRKTTAEEIGDFLIAMLLYL